jgi:hypothetical protein
VNEFVYEKNEFDFFGKYEKRKKRERALPNTVLSLCVLYQLLLLKNSCLHSSWVFLLLFIALSSWLFSSLVSCIQGPPFDVCCGLGYAPVIL